jgi:hypothetical protein
MITGDHKATKAGSCNGLWIINSKRPSLDRL